MKKIPFTRPTIGAEELAIVKRAILEKRIGGNGFYTKKAEDFLTKKLKVKHAYLTTSATHALEMSMMCIDLKRGDEVICPSFTFVSTANAIIRQGGTPVFCDIEPNTLNIDVDKVGKLITKRTRAVVPVHYAAISCNMDDLLDIGRRYKIRVIEDAAQAVGAKYKNKFLGTMGDMGALSFHVTKNVTCGEGGAFLTNSDLVAKKAEIIREKGTNRNAFLRGSVDKYTWVDVGSSFVPSDLLSAMLYAQLKKIENITNRRREIFDYYFMGLKPLEDVGLLTLPVIPEYATSNGHIFWFLTDSEASRDRLLKGLKECGIDAAFHYVPLHTSPYGRRVLGYRKGDLPVTESVANRLCRLPLFPELTAQDLNNITKAVARLLLKRGV